MADPVCVHGIWLRKIGDDLQVLAEVAPGDWRLVITSWAAGQLSHIVEPRGIVDAPPDPLRYED